MVLAMRTISQRGAFSTESMPYGRSRLGQALEYWPASTRTKILIVGGFHGEEPDTTVMLSRALRTVGENPKHVTTITAANPDGLVRGTRGNAGSVDLNRNFPTVDWRPGTVTHRWSSEHESDVLLGTGHAAGSEPEVSALVDLIGDLRPQQIISLHGHLNCVEDPDESELCQWIAARTSLPVLDHIGYETPGSMGTWAAEKKIPIITWELPPESIESMYHTQLPVLIDILKGDCPM